MEEQPKLAPFILKPHRINNYTHLIALLKVKQKKYKDYTYSAVNTAFSNVLGTLKENLELENVFEGFLHEKLSEKAMEFEQQIFSDFSKSINTKIKEIKIENDQKVYSNKIGNLAECESLLFTKPTPLTFKDDLLFDLYQFINKKSTPISFLQQSFMKYMLKFFNENSSDATDFDKDGLDSLTLKRTVKEFVKLRYNSEEYKIEVYESRYLWAEIFVLLRIGRTDLALEVINENEIYFEFMTNKFKSIFVGFLNGKKSNFVHNFRNEDRFKKFLYEMAEEKAKSDGLIISTVEDYLWLKLVLDKEIKTDVSEFSNSKVKFMITLLSKKYMKAIDILLKSDFGIVPKFFLLRELCLEQSCNEFESTNVFDMSNTVKSQTKTRILHEDSSSTTSLMSVPDGNATSTITPIFLNFLFNLVSKLSTKEHKVKLVEMLKNHCEYYSIVPVYIIKYNLFDILGKTPDVTGNLEFSLDSKIASKVLSLLKEKGDRSKIIQLYHLIDDVSMIQFLKEAIEEAILTDETLDVSILEKYLKKKITKDSVDLENMYGLYKFYTNPSISNLKASVLFDQSINLRPYRFVIEKLFSKAVDVIKLENDQKMAKQIFKLSGILDLNEECSSKLSKDLVSLI